MNRVAGARRAWRTFSLVLLMPLLLAAAFHPVAYGQDSATAPPAAPKSSPESSEAETYAYTPAERVEDYLDRTIGPEALLTSALMAGLDQARDKPEGWQQGGKGYGQRFVSRLGRQGVSSTIQLALEAALQEDSRYTPQEAGSALSRVSHSLSHTFMAKTPSGRRAPPIGRFAGIIGGAFISRTWYPEGDDSFEDGARAAGLSLGIYTGMNVFREFLPDIKRIFKK